jgi:predicted small metal-binding protein
VDAKLLLLGQSPSTYRLAARETMCRDPGEEASMPKLIKCSCGKIVHGDTDDELITNAEAHIREDHPDLVGKISRDDLLAMAEAA